MFQFDELKALRKLMDETGDKVTMLHVGLNNMKKIDERLHHCFMAWLNDEELPDFEFRGLSLSIIIAKTPCHYVHSLLRMNRVLQSDDPLAKIKIWLERRTILKQEKLCDLLQTRNMKKT